MSVSKKDGTTLVCKIDTFDAERIKNAGTWFAEWHKDYNNFLVQRLVSLKVNGKTKKQKQTLQSFILDVNPKAPIKHLNGNTLDNRKNNLELFDRHAKNDCEKVDHQTTGIILRDKFGNKKQVALIDSQDANKVIKDGYNWVTYKKNDSLMIIANTPKGRVRLDNLIMNVDSDEKEKEVHHINLNPLDNRRKNLEIKELV